MRFISIDVGIKNLAFCVFTTQNTSSILIEKWGIVDLSREKEIPQSIKYICSCKSTKKEKKCNSIAKWKKGENQYYCMKHAKEQSSYLLPNPQLKTSYLQKQNMNILKELLDKYKIIVETPPLLKKENIVELLTTHIQNHLLESLSPSTTTNASDLDLVTIGKNMKAQFNILFDNIKIDRVIIENQISPIANRMKTIQGMIAQYFIMTSKEEDNIQIDFVNSSNKLKLSTNQDIKTKTYKDRKKEGIQLVNTYLTCPIWASYFGQHKKKDDLADCYLQGVWYVKNKLSHS